MLAVFLTIILNGKVYAGECLGPSEEEKYQSLLLAYQKLEESVQQDILPIYGSRCWSPNNDINEKTRILLEKILHDDRINDKNHLNAVDCYIELYGPNVFLQPVIKSLTGIDREKIIEKLLYFKLTETFGSESFFKDEISKESNVKLKQKMVERLANEYLGRFYEFERYCRENNLEITPHVLVRFKDLDALNYLYEKTDFLAEKFSAPYDYADSYSDYIYRVLARNLEKVFLEKYLESLEGKELRHLRNGIFATYGKNFKSKNLQYYFYGSYSYVQLFCRNGTCGLNKPKGSYKESDLTEIDKANINAILNVESERSKTNKNNQNVFVENYNFSEFINGSKDNFVFSSSTIHELKQFKIDWDRHEIFLWDKRGVSGWNYLTGKRFKLINNARGPIGLAPNKRLIAYQINGNVVVENIDDSRILFNATIERPMHNNWINTVNYFTKGETFFVTQVERGRLKVFNTSTELNNDVDFARWSARSNELICTDTGSASITLLNSPIAETDGKQLIGMVSDGLFVFPLDNPQMIKHIEFDYNDKRAGYCSISLSPNQEYLYADPGFKGFITRFYMEEIDKAQDTSQVFHRLVSPGNQDLRYIATLKATDDFLFRGSTSSFGWINLSGSENSGTNSYKGISGSASDISVDKRMLALGDSRGFVVFKKFPHANSE